MAYNLSSRSKSRLEGVEEDLVKVVERAIELTEVDFGVIQGLRTMEEQKALVAKGASKTMKSKLLQLSWTLAFVGVLRGVCLTFVSGMTLWKRLC